MRFVYGILPYFVIRSNKYVQEWADATTYWMFVFVKKNVEYTKALAAHEHVHIEQKYRYLMIPFLFLYKYSQKWRLKFEIEAFKKTMEFSDRTAESIAKSLMTDYKITYIPYNEILDKLRM